MRYLLCWSHLPYLAHKTTSLLRLQVRLSLPQKQGDEVFTIWLGLQKHRSCRNRPLKEHAPGKSSRTSDRIRCSVSLLLQQLASDLIEGEFSSGDLREHPQTHLQLIINIYYPFIHQSLGKTPSAHWMMPTITPNNPKALPKISTTSIFTKESGF